VACVNIEIDFYMMMMNVVVVVLLLMMMMYFPLYPAFIFKNESC